VVRESGARDTDSAAPTATGRDAFEFGRRGRVIRVGDAGVLGRLDELASGASAESTLYLAQNGPASSVNTPAPRFTLTIKTVRPIH